MSRRRRRSRDPALQVLLPFVASEIDPVAEGEPANPCLFIHLGQTASCITFCYSICTSRTRI
jgi:hypothetical protein